MKNKIKKQSIIKSENNRCTKYEKGIENKAYIIPIVGLVINK